MSELLEYLRPICLLGSGTNGAVIRCQVLKDQLNVDTKVPFKTSGISQDTLSNSKTSSITQDTLSNLETSKNKNILSTTDSTVDSSLKNQLQNLPDYVAVKLLNFFWDDASKTFLTGEKKALEALDVIQYEKKTCQRIVQIFSSFEAEIPSTFVSFLPEQMTEHAKADPTLTTQFFVMHEYYVTLAKWKTFVPVPLNPSQLCSLTFDLIKAGIEMERAHVVHLDMKSDNIMLDASGHAVVTDFGLSLVCADASLQIHLQNTDSLILNRYVTAPEVLVAYDTLQDHEDQQNKHDENEKQIDHLEDPSNSFSRSMVDKTCGDSTSVVLQFAKQTSWSIGNLLYEICTGHCALPEYPQSKSLVHTQFNYNAVDFPVAGWKDICANFMVLPLGYKQHSLHTMIDNGTYPRWLSFLIHGLLIRDPQQRLSLTEANQILLQNISTRSITSSYLGLCLSDKDISTDIRHDVSTFNSAIRLRFIVDDCVTNSSRGIHTAHTNSFVSEYIGQVDDPWRDCLEHVDTELGQHLKDNCLVQPIEHLALVCAGMIFRVDDRCCNENYNLPVIHTIQDFITIVMYVCTRSEQRSLCLKYMDSQEKWISSEHTFLTVYVTTSATNVAKYEFLQTIQQLHEIEQYGRPDQPLLHKNSTFSLEKTRPTSNMVMRCGMGKIRSQSHGLQAFLSEPGIQDATTPLICDITSPLTRQRTKSNGDILNPHIQFNLISHLTYTKRVALSVMFVLERAHTAIGEFYRGFHAIETQNYQDNESINVENTRISNNKTPRCQLSKSILCTSSDGFMESDEMADALLEIARLLCVFGSWFPVDDEIMRCICHVVRNISCIRNVEIAVNICSGTHLFEWICVSIEHSVPSFVTIANDGIEALSNFTRFDETVEQLSDACLNRLNSAWLLCLQYSKRSDELEDENAIAVMLNKIVNICTRLFTILDNNRATVFFTQNGLANRFIQTLLWWTDHETIISSTLQLFSSLTWNVECTALHVDCEALCDFVARIAHCEQYQTNERVLLQAVTIMRNLSCVSTSQCTQPSSHSSKTLQEQDSISMRLVKSGAVTTVETAMVQFPMNEKIMENGRCTLYNLATLCAQDLESISEQITSLKISHASNTLIETQTNTTDSVEQNDVTLQLESSTKTQTDSNLPMNDPSVVWNKTTNSNVGNQWWTYTIPLLTYFRHHPSKFALVILGCIVLYIILIVVVIIGAIL